MKKRIIITVLLLVVIACKKENNPIEKFKEAVDNVKEVKQGFEGVQKVLEGSEDVKENIERLSKLEPVTSSQIKKWLPKKLGNFKQTKFKIESQMGVSLVNLTFENNEKKEIDIRIVDGADVGSAAISMFLMAQNANIESEDNTGYMRTENFDNHKVMVTYKNPEHNEMSEIKSVLANRFLLEAKASEMKPKKLWEYVQQLKIEKLTNN